MIDFTLKVKLSAKQLAALARLVAMLDASGVSLNPVPSAPVFLCVTTSPSPAARGFKRRAGLPVSALFSEFPRKFGGRSRSIFKLTQHADQVFGILRACDATSVGG